MIVLGSKRASNTMALLVFIRESSIVISILYISYRGLCLDGVESDVVLGGGTLARGSNHSEKPSLHVVDHHL